MEPKEKTKKSITPEPREAEPAIGVKNRAKQTARKTTKISGAMGQYSPEEIEKIRANIAKVFSKKDEPAWKPDWSLHEELGLEIPEIMSKEELESLISRSGSTPSNDQRRKQEIWDPYIDAEIERAKAERAKYLESLPDYLQQYATEKRFLILGGTSATGKSSLRKRLLLDRMRVASPRSITDSRIQGLFTPGSVIVDPDNAKLIIPEYQAHLEHLIPGGASFVHEESRNIAEALRQRALAEDLPIIYDTSGQFNGGSGTIQEMIDAGYDVPAIYVVADMDTLKARVRNRERSTGRGVSNSIVQTIQNNIGSVVPYLISSNLVTHMVILDSSDLTNIKTLLDIKRDPNTGTFNNADYIEKYILRQYFNNYFDGIGLK